MSGGLWFSVACLAVVAVLVMAASTKGGSKSSFKDSARRLERAHPVKGASQAERTQEAAHLHPDAPDIGPGLTVGWRGESGEKRMFQGWRECSVHVWGTGRGKTTTEVIRHAVEAPGAFVATANKPDGIREIIAGRRDRGRVWVFDPQGILEETPEPAMTFDLFASIVDTMSADEVASIFDVASAGTAGAGRDPQFDSQGRDLLSACFLAAREGALPPSTVLEWVSSGKLREPEKILREAGHQGRAALLKGIGEQPEDTRGSVLATAQRMGSALTHDVLVRWATPTPGVRRFDPSQFVKGNDTLLLLTQDTAGSAAAFISTLLHAVFMSAKKEAQKNRGRLRVPLVADLDEVGNVVKLPKLPDWFSFFGSMGIVVSAYYQTRGQGVDMLKESGWDTLWAAAAIRVYGGGSDDEKLLKMLNSISGRYEHRTTTYTTSRMQRSNSSSVQQRDIMPVDKLADLPQWRAWVRVNKGGTAIVRTRPWFHDERLREWIETGLEEMGE